MWTKFERLILSMHKLKSGEPSKLFTLKLRELNQKRWLKLIFTKQYKSVLLLLCSKYLSNLPRILPGAKVSNDSPPNLSNVFFPTITYIEFCKNSDVNIFFYLPKSVFELIKDGICGGFWTLSQADKVLWGIKHKTRSNWCKSVLLKDISGRLTNYISGRLTNYISGRLTNYISGRHTNTSFPLWPDNISKAWSSFWPTWRRPGFHLAGKSLFAKGRV